jgi:hypothetical protein
VKFTSDKVYLGFRAGTSNYWLKSGNTTLVVGQKYSLALNYLGDGSSPELYIDGSLETLSTVLVLGDVLNGIVDSGQPLTVGSGQIIASSKSYSSGIFYNARLHGSTLSGSQVTGLVSNVDSGLEVWKQNGYGNTDADWTDQVGSNDGTVNGSPALLRIPADTSAPTKDVLGDTLTNPSITDGYNGAETELDAYNIAEGDNPSPATNNNPDLDAIEFGTDFAANDAAYMRLKSSTENDRLITFADDLTGGDETLAQKYTQ